VDPSPTFHHTLSCDLADPARDAQVDIPTDRPCIRPVSRVSRLSLLLLLPLADLAFGEFPDAAPPQPATPPVARAIPAVSLVHEAVDDRAVTKFRTDPGVIRSMVGSVVRRTTGCATTSEAWQSLLKPGDRIGIKINATGAPLGGTRIDVVEAVLGGLDEAGIPRGRVLVWDRDGAAMRRGGYTPERLRCRVASLTGRGSDYDPEVYFTSMVLGSLIHGDLGFEKTRGAHRGSPESLSNRSHLAQILAREVNRVINIPSLTHHTGCGVAGALVNLTLPNVDNWRRFLQDGRAGDPFLPEIYADPAVGGKVAITLLDSLIVQYAGGPAFDPNYSVHHGAILASLDPVAIDGVALQRINDYRIAARMPLLGREARHLLTAEEMGLGNLNPRAVRLLPAR